MSESVKSVKGVKHAGINRGRLQCGECSADTGAPKGIGPRSAIQSPSSSSWLHPGLKGVLYRLSHHDRDDHVCSRCHPSMRLDSDAKCLLLPVAYEPSVFIPACESTVIVLPNSMSRHLLAQSMHTREQLLRSRSPSPVIRLSVSPSPPSLVPTYSRMRGKSSGGMSAAVA